MLGDHKFWIWNLLTKCRDSLIEVKMDDVSYSLQDFALYKNKLYASNLNREIHIIDLESEKQTKFLLPFSCQKIEVIDNFLFGFNPNENQIVILDITTKQSLAVIPFSSQMIESNLQELVEIIKANLEATGHHQNEKNKALLAGY